MIDRKTAVLAVITVLLFGMCVFAADWPQWRGPARDGVWSETGVIEKFETSQLPVVWRSEIGGGYSGPTVSNGKVYITDRVKDSKEIERIHCFDAMSGKKIWSYEYECKYGKVGYSDGPRTSVAVDGARVYSLGTMGNLFCLDSAKGNVVWSKDLKAEYDVKLPIWGIAASPLVEGDLVIVQVGGKDDACLIGFDKVTGVEKWRALNDEASYSSPIIIEQAGERVLVCLTGGRLVGLDPLSGKLYWEVSFKPLKVPLGVASPVFHNGYIFVTSFYDGSMLVKVNPDKLEAEMVWHRKGESEYKTDALHCMISTPILQGNHIYGVDSYGQLRCLDLLTGDRIWEDLTAVPKARWATIHMVRNADKVWMFNERGELIISTLSVKGFHEISRAKLIDPTEGQLGMRGGVCWSHPAYANKHVYIRNDNEILCADLGGAVETNWPRFRGPNDNGTVDSGNYPVKWDPDKVLWKIDVPGKGSSTPIVWNNNIYLTTGAEGQDTVIAYDLAGKQIWLKQLGKETKGKHQNASGSNPSPATDGSGIFVFFKSGNFAALELDGKVRWTTNLFERFGKDERYWDFGTSPVLTKKDVVMAQMHDGESWLAAFDKVTGKLSWKVARNYETAMEGKQGYSTPIVFSHNGTEALLVWGGHHLTAHDAADGKIIWSVGDFNPDGEKLWGTVATPVIVGDIAVVPTGRDDRNQPRLHGIRMGGSGDVTRTHRLWKRKDTGPYIPSPTEYKGRVYITCDRGRFDCIDPLTGKSFWNGTFPKGKGNFYSSPLIAGGHLYAVREDGTVFVLGLEDKFEIISTIDMKDKIIASPIAVSGRLLIRTRKHLFCIGNK